MLKKVVNYEDFDGNERTETLYFNMMQTELVDFALDLPEGLSDSLGDDPNAISEQAAISLMDTLGQKGIMEFVKKLVLKSYGIKSDDGRKFEKSEEISKEFSQTIAFDMLMMELMTDENKAIAFVNAVIPASAVNKKPAISVTQ